MLLSLLGLALAIPLQITVVPDTSADLARRPRTLAGRLPLDEARIRLDGVRDVAWDKVAPGPPLLPLLNGQPEPGVSARAAQTPEGLAVWITGVPDDWTAVLAVDPEGVDRANWRLTFGPEGASAEVCTQPTWEESNFSVGVPTYPCTALPSAGAMAHRGPEGIELGLPWSVMAPATTRMKVLVSLSGPRGGGGTWASNGSTALYPYLGLQLDTVQPRGWGRVDVDPTTGEWTVSLNNVVDADRWVYRRTRMGTEHGVGVLDLTVSDTVTLPALEAGLVTFRAETDDRVAPGFIVRQPDRRPSLHLATPAFGPHILVHYSTSRAADTVVRLTDHAGNELGSSTVSLPQGSGVLQVVPPAGAPPAMFLDAEPGLIPVRVLKTP